MKEITYGFVGAGVATVVGLAFGALYKYNRVPITSVVEDEEGNKTMEKIGNIRKTRINYLTSSFKKGAYKIHTTADEGAPDAEVNKKAMFMHLGEDAPRPQTLREDIKSAFVEAMAEVQTAKA